MQNKSFKISPQLTKLLSENYRPTELALKELVDNAWDADASNVNIALPGSMTGDPIVIEDDGSGMTEDELDLLYLNVASNRRFPRGKHTNSKKRKVKGRKGIGKFAGLQTASHMQLTTWSNGKEIIMEFNFDKFQDSNELSSIDIPAIVNDCAKNKTGVRIVLTNLYQSLKFPNPVKLKDLLIREYGREKDFLISINCKTLDITDIQGVTDNFEKEFTGLGQVKVRLAITNKKNFTSPGFTLRVGGKVVGQPTFFGLDQSDDSPPKLLKKCFGEVEADGLINDVTADWGAIIENSEGYQRLEQALQPVIKEKFAGIFGREINLQKAKIQKKVNDRLAKLPEFKRDLALNSINKILQRYYDDPIEKIEPIVNVLLDAIEISDYRTVLEHINTVKNADISTFAQNLEKFGMVEMAKMLEQTSERLKFLDWFDELCSRTDVQEIDIHRIIESNLWLLGPKYSLFSSNKTLKKMSEQVFGKKYEGENANKRPDLMVGENINGELLIIEFKKPSHPLDVNDYQQVTNYRHSFLQISGKSKIKVMLLGGKKSQSNYPGINLTERDTQISLYRDIISTARRQLEWLLKELKNDSVVTVEEMDF